MRRDGIRNEVGLERDDTPLGDEGVVDRLVRITARFCSLLIAAKKRGWFDTEVRFHVRDLRIDLLRSLEHGPVHVELDGDTLRLGQAEYSDPPKVVKQFLRMFRRKGYRAVTFASGLTEVEIVVLCRILRTKTATADVAELAKLRHIELHEAAKEPSDRIAIPEVQRRSRLAETLDEGPDAGREIREDVAEITTAIEELVRSSDEVAEGGESESAPGLVQLLDKLGGNAEIALILSSLRRHDAYTYDHSVNVGLLSICIARALGWKGRDLHEFGVAALIHDVGKLYTPVEVLNKPGRFTPQEWIVMKRHPRDGYDILSEGGVGGDLAPNIALKHHIAYDGTGYPPVADDPVDAGAQIVRIADVYDAFTTIRPYRSQARPTEVLKMLRKQGGANFNPEFIEAFCEVMGEHPIGSTVKLSSGRIGLVVDVHLQLRDRPVVRILQDEQGRKPESLELVELSRRDRVTGECVDSIVETIDPVIRNIPVGRYI
jgi:HD-GYP domain-containing protein (c-di-GMP phosphodiesterase class II)